ncbi:MAG: ribonuclease HIII, partial [Lentisphaeria bacterium]|nr:ribonuclease HIII [Lentisphaeria bacterium]
AAFIRQMDAMSQEFGIKLIRGAGPQVRLAAVQLVEKYGPDVLEECAKVHFKTYNEVLGLPLED